MGRNDTLLYVIRAVVFPGWQYEDGISINSLATDMTTRRQNSLMSLPVYPSIFEAISTNWMVGSRETPLRNCKRIWCLWCRDGFGTLNLRGILLENASSMSANLFVAPRMITFTCSLLSNPSQAESNSAFILDIVSCSDEFLCLNKESISSMNIIVGAIFSASVNRPRTYFSDSPSYSVRQILTCLIRCHDLLPIYLSGLLL